MDTLDTHYNQKSARRAPTPPGALPPAAHLPLQPTTGFKLTNEHANEQTNQQTLRIAIPPDGRKDKTATIVIYYDVFVVVLVNKTITVAYTTTPSPQTAPNPLLCPS